MCLIFSSDFHADLVSIASVKASFVLRITVCIRFCVHVRMYMTVKLFPDPPPSYYCAQITVPVSSAMSP